MKFMFSKMLAIALLFSTLQGSAQTLTMPVDGSNRKASVSERIGLTDVTINYDRPAVKGREGKIWGQLVHYGFKYQDFGTSKAAPWRAGANENTTITFSTDVKIEGKPLAAGTYAIFMAMQADAATVIFSKNATSWGSYFYDEKEDALRVDVKTGPLSNLVERLTFDFSEQAENSAVVALTWEKLRIPFRVEVDVVQTQLASFRRELRNVKGFEWQNVVQAANWCVEKNVNLDEANAWADYAMSADLGNTRNFQTLSCKANVLNKLGKTADADKLMKEALPMGKMQEVHTYARGLLTQKRSKEAFDVFKMNYDKNPNEFMAMMGIIRGYSAMGDYKKALELAEKAAAKAPDAGSKSNVAKFIDLLKAGKDVNAN
jgi:tetratricopeptide (TPR) repeat protein